MKNYVRRPMLLTAILIILFGFLVAYLRGDIGISEESMIARELEQIQEERPLYGGVSESMAVFLDFQEDLTDINVDIYVKQKGRFGWFFRYGHSTAGQQDYLVQMNCEGNEEYVLMYLSADPISHIEVEKDDGEFMTINPEIGKPFAYVMKHTWNVTVYDEDGSAVIPLVRSL